MVSGGDLFYLKFWVNLPPLERNRRFWTDIHLAKKVQLTLIKSTTRFPMSLRWPPYVAPKPPKGEGAAQKRKTAVFLLKSHFAWRKSATKFICVKTVSDKVVRNSLANLSVQKWFAVDVPYYVKIWPKLAKRALQKRLFPTNIRS